MSSFNVTNDAQRTMPHADASSSSRASVMPDQPAAADTFERTPSGDVSSASAGPAVAPPPAADKALKAETAASSSSSAYAPPPRKGPAKESASSSSSEVPRKGEDKAPQKAPLQDCDSSSSEAPCKGEDKAPAKGGRSCRPNLNPANYRKELLACIENGDNFGSHHAAYEKMRDIVRRLIAAHGDETDYDAILRPLDLRLRKLKTERECNRLADQDDQQQTGRYISIERTPGGAVNLWSKAVYVETHRWKLKKKADRKAGLELCRATVTLIEQASANMSDHHIRLHAKSSNLKRHIKHLSRALYERPKDAAPNKGGKAPVGSDAPAKKGWFSGLGKHFFGRK